jgi:glycosyltransferase involved in cell wall biosynthesis
MSHLFLLHLELMRVLIIHNEYQNPGGEDVVFDQETEILREIGVTKKILFKNETGWKGFIQFLSYPFNKRAAKKITQEINAFQPDIIHFHNLHYAIGPYVIRKIHRMRIPMVMTLHNYRLICPSATLYYNGHIYTNSIQAGFPWHATLHGVHEHSIIKTAWIALTYYIHKKLGTWNKIDRYLVLTEFAKNQFLKANLNISKDKFTVKPNFIKEIPGSETAQSADPSTQTLTKNPSDAFLFVGRLSAEKGIQTLLSAFENKSKPLFIVGDGPLKHLAEAHAQKHENIQYLGTKTPLEVRALMHECNALIFPSEWYEGMPMTIIEALSTGTAVIASNLGAMQEMISNDKNGYLFEKGNAESLYQTIEQWDHLSDTEKNQIRAQAKNLFIQKYTAVQNRSMLIDIYRPLLK